MCGIAGAFCPQSPPSDRDLQAMNDCLVHRGPHDEGVYRSGPVGLAHRRLSIIDPDAGAQPVFNEDGSVAVAFNGEIYNYRSLRERLVANGHRFRTETDTEVLVHLYEEHGPALVDELDGMFAFALWDDDASKLVLARDRMGIKPLCVARDDGAVAFGSEMRAVLASPVAHGGLDRAALGEYFGFGYVPAPKTAFSNVDKLLPGEVWTVTDEGVTRDRYDSPEIEPVRAEFDAAATTLRDLVERAVEKRLMADVPLGAFLSGGIDSSIVVGLLAELTEEPVRTFSVGFGERQFDETWAARTVAEYHGTDHHEFHVTPDDVRDLVPTVVGSLGEPFADPSILPTYVVARETSREVTVALSGDGADELFAGYNKYRGEYYSKYYRSLPGVVRSKLLNPAIDRAPAARDSRIGELSRMAQKFVRGGEPDRARRQFQWMTRTTEDTARAVPDLAVGPGGTDRVATAQSEATAALPDERQDDMAVVQYVDARFALPDGILHKVDSASMQNSLEVRVPFLDTDVFEYAMGLPTAFLITRSDRKRILKHAFEDILPDEIRRRKKQGFEPPIGEWFKDELADDFTATVAKANTDIVDSAAVDDIYREHTDGSRDHSRFLWTVYVFLEWLESMRDDGVIDAVA